MTVKTYELEVPVTVRITVADEPVGDTDMHPLDPRRMEGIYELETPTEMLRHLAYNAIRNGLTSASVLDGWGDIWVLPDGADAWPAWQRRFYVEDHYPVRMEIVDVDTGGAVHFDAPPETVT